MRDDGFDCIIATLPENVLLLTGYFPVVGTAVAVADSQGKLELLVPEDDRDLAKTGDADGILTFESASLERISTPVRPFANLSEAC